MQKKCSIRIILALLIGLSFVIISCGGGGGSGDGHTISGTVTVEGVGLPGFAMTLHCSNVYPKAPSYTKTKATDSKGDFSFHVGTDFCAIRASKYGFETRSWSSGNYPVLGDMIVNFTTISCQAECPIVTLYTPENNFVISSPIDIEGIWDRDFQAVIFSGSVSTKTCGGASYLDINYTIDGQLVSQTYKDNGWEFLCWNGDPFRTNCEPMQTFHMIDPILSSDYSSSVWPGIRWRSVPYGSHTWHVRATNLYSGCTTSSEVRTLIIQPLM